jgi:UDP:flavonoid glycosyltransferase YjiC (YdhE family)
MGTSLPRTPAGAVDGGAAAGRRLRVLVVLELGGNWGHLLRLLPVVEALRARGHAVTLATPDVAGARAMFTDEAVDVVAWPTLRGHIALAPDRRFLHYAQLLEHCVFGDARTLRISVQRWMSQLRRLRPDVMLADFAPGALFAAYLRRLPAVQLATGWESPPAGQPLPFLRAGYSGDATRFERMERALLERLNHECAMARVTPLGQVSDVHARGNPLLATWPEIDHFGPRVDGRYVGPVYTEDLGERVEWPEQAGLRSRVVVYLARDARNQAIVEALSRLGTEVVAVLPGILPQEADRLRCGHVRVFDRPIQLGRLVARARLAVTNGGHGLMGVCLKAGVPMLLLPRFAEQALLAERLQRAGLAWSLLPFERGGELDLAVIDQALADLAMPRKLQAIARRLDGASVQNAIATTVAAIERAGGMSAAASRPLAAPGGLEASSAAGR